ncbi:MAG: nucleoside triphosphate pyrophosphohydrolase [Hahellaceae bacterium]|nr:nucleoside triphosphate pyrophosphohydrolase [Hahellaceae bacterium]MCP5212365.1 nucleoside triphosphate pyrophosphohydrolase [Hahellaceae bacterium]
MHNTPELTDVAPTASPVYTLDDLLYLMARLRSPEDGCPWDLKQTYATIVPHTIEEAYEVADAIHKRDFPHLKEELGDLLFQVIFYAQLGVEDQHFDFKGIISDLVAKLIRRHPHVFPAGTLRSRPEPGSSISESEIKANWEKIKTAEELAKKEAKQLHTESEVASLLDAVPKTLPGLLVAEKLQKKAATVGFDWKHIDPVFDKLHEELDELKEAWQDLQVAASTAAQDTAVIAQKQQHVEDELGDLLFVCVNLARFMKVKPESAITRTNNKFRQRFAHIEAVLNEKGQQFADATLDELEAIWQSAKTLES